MADLANTCEGVDTVAVPTTNAGTPDKFDTTTVSGAGSTLTWSATHAHNGTTGVQQHFASAVATVANVAWTALPGSPVTNGFTRFYIYLTAYPTVITRIAALQSGVSNRATFSMNTTGGLRAADSANALLGTTTAAIPLNNWVRIECEISGASGTTGTIAARMYSGANLETLTADTNGSLSFAAASIGGTMTIARVGTDTTATQTAALDVWIDDVGFSSVAAPGPYKPTRRILVASAAVSRSANW